MKWSRSRLPDRLITASFTNSLKELPQNVEQTCHRTPRTDTAVTSVPGFSSQHRLASTCQNADFVTRQQPCRTDLFPQRILHCGKFDSFAHRAVQPEHPADAYRIPIRRSSWSSL